MEEFSNRDKDIFIIKTRKMIDRGALMSRYSRTSELDIRVVYDREFSASETRGEDFYRKVFLEYGDESVAELVTAQVAIQNVSNLCTWTMEEKRIGLSFLEKSSRYVEYQEGSRLYLEAARTGFPEKFWDRYSGICDDLFRLYRNVMNRAISYYRSTYPVSGYSFRDADGKIVPYDQLSDDKKIASASKAYERAIKARALDDARFCLPFSTLTNLGVSGNGRAYIDLIQKLNSSGIPELSHVAESLYLELRTEFPNLIDNAVSRHGKESQEFNMARDHLETTFKESQEQSQARILKCEDESDVLDTMGIALGFLKSGITDAGNALSSENSEVVSYINRIAGLRENRRQKPGRIFEIPEYICSVTCSLGTLRDFQRHRMMTILKRPVNPLSEYIVPESVMKSPGLRKAYSDTMERAKQLWEDIFPEAGITRAQYVVPFAFYQKILFKIDLREMTYFMELRSGSAAHFEIRKIANELYKELTSRHPRLSRIVRFVDPNDYPLGRLGAEIRKEDRLSGP